MVASFAKYTITTLLTLVASHKLLVTSALAVDIGKEYNSPVKELANIGGLVSAVAGNLYLIAGVIVFIFFLWGGFEYIRGAGSDDRDAIGRGKKVIFSAITGFLIIFVSYWIIQLIEALTNIKIF
ncbi:MAG: hypothetical protein A2782_03885 [Candidatus Blackburnbacteria bacterium RIFCSPHIGHO2_01_FULL_43_15b]|uniref:Uncharacterized protein n=1 Tax=Candidatus Blackburnbacteria bacterium RIFCSPHIGHO2_01_FULL_43_15b TaxID=1797513 RepID=A0A1G1UYH3_9BACT|nr:MAG: hypothetical protein A2782_03885 [Candidatus Blackburnbacteria bacterium RIFCSPHIGHO2_01_FULL_43_15b]